MKAPEGVEPSTFRLLGGRSNQLSYRAWRNWVVVRPSDENIEYSFAVIVFFYIQNTETVSQEKRFKLQYAIVQRSYFYIIIYKDRFSV